MFTGEEGLYRSKGLFQALTQANADLSGWGGKGRCPCYQLAIFGWKGVGGVSQMAGRIKAVGWGVWLPPKGGGPASHGAIGAAKLCKQEAQPRPAWLKTADLVLLEPVAQL